MRAPISVVIPTLNAASRLPACLGALGEGLNEGLIRELVVSDGGSEDATLAIAEAAGAEVVSGPPSRGGQLRRGVAATQGDWLLMLHADTVLLPGWAGPVAGVLGTGEAWYFRLRFDAVGPSFGPSFGRDFERDFGPESGRGSGLARSAGSGRDASLGSGRDSGRGSGRGSELGSRFGDGLAPVVAAGWANLRSRALGLPYGDQGLLIPRALYDRVGGYPDIALMEDVALARALRGHLRGLDAVAQTSAMKYRQQGWMRRGGRNLWTLARYLAGADPDALARDYRRQD